MKNRLITTVASVLLTLIFWVNANGAEKVKADSSVRSSPSKGINGTVETTPTASRKVDLNTATKEELEALPGIGATTADAIIAARPFKTIDELNRVQGIGDAKFAQVKNHVRVGHTGVGASATAANPAVKTTRPEAKSGSKSDVKEAGIASKVDLNSADREALIGLPGIGEATADAIIAARPFKSVDDLKAVKGIGDARFAELQPLVVVRSNRSSNTSNTGRPAATSKETASSKIPGSGAASKSSGGELPKGDGTSVKRTGNQSEIKSANAKININTASRAELEDLLGIGPVKAQAIIDGRPYKTIEDVMNVKGIKEGTFGEIRDRITVR